MLFKLSIVKNKRYLHDRDTATWSYNRTSYTLVAHFRALCIVDTEHSCTHL